MTRPKRRLLPILLRDGGTSLSLVVFHESPNAKSPYFLFKLPEGYLEGTIDCVIPTELTEAGFLFNSTHRIAFLSLNFLKPNTIKRIGFCWEKLKRYIGECGQTATER